MQTSDRDYFHCGICQENLGKYPKPKDGKNYDSAGRRLIFCNRALDSIDPTIDLSMPDGSVKTHTLTGPWVHYSECLERCEKNKIEPKCKWRNWG
jgi:hypothetical protein